MDQELQKHPPQRKIVGVYDDAAVVFATSLLENANDLFAIINTDLRFVGLNAAFRREFKLVFGCQVELGQSPDEILAHVTGDRDKATSFCRRALAGESFRVVEEFGDEKLLRKTYEMAFSPIFDTHYQPLMAAIVVRDLTMLHLSEQRFGALLEAAPDAMIIIRSDGIVDLANAHAERLFRYDRHQLTGLPIEMLLPERFRRTHQAERQRFNQQPVARAMGKSRVDLLGLRANGEEFPVEISLSPLEVGGEKMVVSAIRDMTVRQRAEDQLRKMSAELEQRVASRTAALEQANAALQQANHEYRTTFEQAIVGMAHVAPDGRWLRVNQSLCEIVGYTSQEMLEMTVEDIIHPDDLDAGLKLIAQVLAGNLTSFTQEKRYRHKNGSIVWVSVNASLVRGNTGAAKYFVAVINNIDARKQAEQALQQQQEILQQTNERLALALKSGRSGWFDWDARQNLNRWSDELLALFGFQPGQFGGQYQDWLDCLVPEDRAAADALAQRALETGEFVMEFRIRRRDTGEIRWIHSRAQVDFDDNGIAVRMIGINVDITEQKQAEIQLLDSEARFRTLADNIDQLAWMADETGSRFWYNKRWFDYTGTTAEQVQGWGWQQVHHPAQVEGVLENYRRCFQAGIVWEDTFPLRGRDGHYRWFLSRALPIHDAAGRVQQWFGTATDITRQRQAEQALRRSEAELRATFDQAAVGIAHISVPQRRFLHVNQAFCRIVGYEPDELLSLTVSDLTHPDDINTYEEQYARLMSGQLASFMMEKRYIRKDRAVIWIRKTFSAVRDQHGAALYGISVVEDITDAKQADLVRQETENRLQLAVSIANLGFWEWDVAAGDIFFSAQWKSQLGYQDHELSNGTQEWLLRLHPEDRDQAVATIAAYIDRPTPDFKLEYRLCDRDGNYRTMVANAIAITAPNGQVVKVIGTQLDVTESKLAEQRLLAAARHDPLTGLPNRALVFEYAGHLLASMRRNPRHGALLFIDLDRFKPVNDVYGHGVGDRLLQEAAKRLISCVRDEDLVGRLGGDEFVIMLSQISGPRATTVARHVLEVLSQPFQINELELSISASIGISHFPDHGADVDALIHAADLAMYQAKQAGRANYHVYTPMLSDRADAASSIEAQLKRALKSSGLLLHYQPVIDIRGHRLMGVEALLRLADGEGQVIAPDRFIPVAEAAGLMTELGEWVAVEACRQHEQWLDQGLPPMTIAINVSPFQFRQRAFGQRLQGIINDARLDPAYFQIEVTESAVMDNVDEVIGTLAQIKSTGIKIALDDFGTGYSSLSHLSHLPLDKLKVNQSFVKGLEYDRTSQAITAAIITLGRSLHLEVVGEGIESANTFAYLQENGCDQAQGFYLSQPLPADQFASWYRAELTGQHFAR